MKKESTTQSVKTNSLMKYLDPKADLTFKLVFGEHPDLVKSFLNALLPLPEGEEIEDLEYCPSEIVPDTPLGKDSIVDVRCKDKMGRQFIVEMQMIWMPEFQQRVLFNASKAYVRQSEAGEDYDLLEPVYSLNIVNDIFEPDLEGYYHFYQMVHTEHTDKVIKGLHLVFIELPKFNPHTFSEKKMHVLWLRYLKEIKWDTEQVAPDLLANPEINKAVSILEKSAYSEAQMASYDRFQDSVRVLNTIKKNLRNNFEKGIKRGIEKGLEKGIKKGIEEGLEKGLKEGLKKGIEEGLEKGLEEGLEKGRIEGEAKGRAEGEAMGEQKKAREIARNLKLAGVPTNIIVQSSGLPEEEIALL